MRWIWLSILGLAAVGRAADVRVTVDAGKPRQVMEGFGASTLSWCDGGVDQLATMRKGVLEAVYEQVKLTMGDIHCSPYEGQLKDRARLTDARAVESENDDDDPFRFHWPGFTWWRSDHAKTKLVDIARPMGLDNFCLRGGINTKWADPWLAELKKKNPQRYLDEAAENAVAILVHWRDKYRIVPRWHQLFNEPLSGNREVAGATTREIVELVRTFGKRLRAEGFDQTMLVVPSEETASKSLETARAILADAEAARYVGAIGYHCYPYGSTYASIRKILEGPGAGRPSAVSVSVREDLRDLARKHRLQTWMTEVSHGGVGGFDMARGRAVHIHDELVYADASSYWAMYNIYDKREKDEDHVVIFDSTARKFWITPMGYAIGHYARWIERGAVRVEAASSDPLVQVTAFHDAKRRTLSLVLINNSDGAQEVSIALEAIASRARAAVKGERSTAKEYWETLRGVSMETATGLKLKLPGHSVTSVGVDVGK
jgi:O-glycosyl hydrolase